MRIHNIKCIKDVAISLPLEKGLYAITGPNGSGKSTIVACASSVFYNLPMNDYFGETADDSSIEFTLDDTRRSWKKNNQKWVQASEGNMNIKGFFEGSLIFGYRFRDTSYDKLKKSSSIDKRKLHASHDFIRTNLGVILQGDENYYEHLYEVSREYEGFNGTIFYYEKNGRLISQFHMSTGENLLISILNSLYIKNKEKARKGSQASIIFLDEIELALHPASLKRLISFLQRMVDTYGYAIYFSTHSIELISLIKPDNIFYVERYVDDSIDITNPCYPAYATKFLYDHSGYDRVILVEDDLAKSIINRILREERLLDSKLVHVLPCGGYTNVIKLADEVIRNNLLGKITSISIVVDKDVKEDAIAFKTRHHYANSAKLNFLPINSLEKYLRQNLFLHVNHKLFKFLSDYLFLQTSLQSLVETYRKASESLNDSSGKAFYNILDTELRLRQKTREDLTEMVVKFIFEENDSCIAELINFLRKEML